MKYLWKERLMLFAMAVVTVVVMLETQWDNIKSLKISNQYRTDEIKAMMAKADDEKQVLLSFISDVTVHEFTDEEKQKILNDEITVEEILEIITKSDRADKPSPSSQSDSSKARGANVSLVSFPSHPSAQTDGFGVENRKATLIRQIYALEAFYSEKLANMLESAKAEYYALAPNKRTEAAKWDIGMKYKRMAESMETSCDEQMESILVQIEQILKDSEGDDSLIVRIREAYENEKSLKKAFYLSMYSQQ